MAAGERVKESSPASFRTFGAATAVTENAGGEVESCDWGRSWQPEIGMEHASRGRRSGNKGVGARWRGRFRIFSARHCSRTKVSHAENSGMTMLFFLWRLLRCRRGILSQARERQHEGLGGLGDSFTRSGVVRHACRHRVTAPRPAAGQARRFLFWGILSHAQERRHEEVFGLGDSFTCSGAAARGEVVWGDYFAVLWRTLSPFVLRVVAGACVGRWTGQPRMPPRERQHEGFDFFGLGNSFTPTGETRRVLMRVLFF